MPATGIRGRVPVSPRDITGRAFAAAQREQAEKKRAEAAGPIDVDAVRKQAFAEGWDKGYDAGVAAVIRQLEAEGLIDPDEPGDEATDGK